VYAEWSDIREYVPEEYRDEADLRSTATNLQQGCEDEIEDSLRSRWSMPVTLAANPKAYATVKDLCAKLTAARALIEWRASDDPEEPATWYADRMIADVRQALAEYQDGTRTFSDASPVSDGGGQDVEDGYDDLTTTEQTYLEPWFSRSDEW